MPTGKGDIIKKGMTLGEVVTKHPETAEVMLKYGLHCIGCHVSAWETIEQGCLAHGMSRKDLDNMVREMNEAARKARDGK